MSEPCVQVRVAGSAENITLRSSPAADTSDFRPSELRNENIVEVLLSSVYEEL